MNLEKLFKLQKELDDHIEKIHPRQEGEDRLAKKILALQVELAECAQESRCFKFWSENQEPNTKVYYGPPELPDVGTYKNPLLEEYVDCLHFILSIGLELGYTFSTVAKWRSSNVNEQFNDIFNAIATLYESIKADWEEEERQDCFSELAKGFLGLGGMLGFTPEQIESAYYEKNAENHRRQEVGY